MPSVSNNGVRIHYEVEGTGPPLVLQHGSFGTLEDWREYGYAEGLRQHRTLVMLDARGHGKSDKPHDAAQYSLEHRASDVVAVLDDIDIRTADFMGYSMGGWIGFGLAKYAPGRFRSFILGGAHPFAEDMAPFRARLPMDPSALSTLMEPAFGIYFTAGQRQRMVANDLKALVALTTDRDDFSEVLATMQMPCLLFVGTADPRLATVRTCIEAMPNARCVELPDLGHVATFCESTYILSHVTAFLSGVG